MRRLLAPVLIAAAALLLVSVWPRLRPRSATAASTTGARVLVRLPEDYAPSTASLSEDGSDYAFVIGASGFCQVVHRTEQGAMYAECGRPMFAPRSHHVFYWAIESGAWYTRLFNWVRHWGATPEKLPVLVANDQVVSPGFAQPAPVVFDAAGTRWAAAGRSPASHAGSTTTPGAALVLADGQVFGRYNDASWPVFSPDGTHLAYLVDDGQVKLIVDGSEQRSFASPTVASPEITQADSSTGLTQQLRVTYLSDGTLMVIAPSGGGWGVYRDHQELASYAHNLAVPEAGLAVNTAGTVGAATAVLAPSLTTAAKAPVAAWWERSPGSGERWHVVRDGAPDGVDCARFWKNYPPLLSADGQHLAYPCYMHPEEEDDQIMLVVDGKQFGPYANAAGLAFSDDGMHFAYAAADGRHQTTGRITSTGRTIPSRSSWHGRHDSTRPAPTSPGRRSAASGRYCLSTAAASARSTRSSGGRCSRRPTRCRGWSAAAAGSCVSRRQ